MRHSRASDGCSRTATTNGTTRSRAEFPTRCEPARSRVSNLNPYSGYYADYASPLMYVISLANLFAWTGDRDRLRAHWDTARRILDWARERGDIDGDGYLESPLARRMGTKNQGWKDSGDAIVYDDGIAGAGADRDVRAAGLLVRRRRS